MNPDLERNLHGRITSIREELARLGPKDYSSAAFFRMREGVDGDQLMDAAMSVGNTTHDPTLRQAVYAYGFAIGVELFAHEITDEHRQNFLLELGMFKHTFDKAQQPDALQDDIDVAIRLTEGAYGAYEMRRTTIHSVTEKIWEHLKEGGGNIADFETAIGMVSLAIENSWHHLPANDDEAPDLLTMFNEPVEKETRLQEVRISAPVSLEEARQIIFRNFERSPHVKRLRDTNVLDREGLLAGLSKAIENLNSGPPGLPFMAKGTDANIRAGSFYMIYDVDEHTKTYHVLPAGWELFGSFERFARDDIPRLSELEAMKARAQAHEFSETYPAGLFMMLKKVSLNYGDTSNMPLSHSHEVYVPMNYPLDGTLFAPPTVQ